CILMFFIFLFGLETPMFPLTFPLLLSHPVNSTLPSSFLTYFNAFLETFVFFEASLTLLYKSSLVTFFVYSFTFLTVMLYLAATSSVLFVFVCSIFFVLIISVVSSCTLSTFKCFCVNRQTVHLLRPTLSPTHDTLLPS